ncbi:helix-turn-helix domain-containing protein [Rickettsia endosymbiont of Urophora cardui]
MAHLTIDERFKIYEMNKSGYSSRYIGTKIGRDKSTISGVSHLAKLCIS